MSNKKKMESKITIHTGDDFKPVIKVIEKLSDDVRDNLVTQFRHLLQHTSKTLTIGFINADDKVLAEYYIHPVENELEYFKDSILNIINYDGVSMNSDQRNFIIDFFDWIKDPTLSPKVKK